MPECRNAGIWSSQKAGRPVILSLYPLDMAGVVVGFPASPDAPKKQAIQPPFLTTTKYKLFDTTNPAYSESVTYVGVEPDNITHTFRFDLVPSAVKSINPFSESYGKAGYYIGLAGNAGGRRKSRRSKRSKRSHRKTKRRHH